MSIAEAAEADQLRDCLTALEPLRRNQALCSRGMILVVLSDRGTRDWFVGRLKMAMVHGGEHELTPEEVTQKCVSSLRPSVY